MHSLQVENGLSVAHNEEKVKNVSLCFLCSYVKSGRVYANTREKNVFSKPIEHCRACSNIVMARKRTFRGTRKELSEVAYNPLSFSNGVVNTMCLVKD